MSDLTNTPGLHGKVPSHGDFVTRRLARSFLDDWDAWLQQAIAASKADLGDQWLDVYLTSPIWSFVLGPGICGSDAWAGVLMPSVDRVGRYFPLTIAVPLPETLSPGDVIAAGGDWFDRARSLALSSLDDEFSLEIFDEAVANLGPVSDEPDSGGVNGSIGDLSSPQGLYVPFAPSGGAARALGRIGEVMLNQSLGSCSLWWSDGSERVPACLLVSRHLPQPNAWTALLDGQFVAGQWQAIGPAPDASTDVGVSP